MPEKPFSPDRPACMRSEGDWLGLGIGLAVFLEFRRYHLETETDVVMAIGLPVSRSSPSWSPTRKKRRGTGRKITDVRLLLCGAAATVVGVLFWVFRWPSGTLVKEQDERR